MTGDDPQVDLLGVTVTALGRSRLIDRLVELARRPAGALPAAVCYANAHVINLAGRDRALRDALSRAALVWPDGVSGRFAMRLAGATMPDRLGGFYLFDELNRRLAGLGLRQFLLGGRAESIRRAADAINERYPSLVAGWHDGYFDAAQAAAIVDRINESAADVLAVGLGSPRQECWIAAHAARLRPRLVWAVGALFDFVSGVEPPAPPWARSAGLEWAWRLSRDLPGKWRRYLVGNPLFVARVLARRPRRIRV